MSTTVNYKGQTLTTVSNDTKTLLTEGKYLEDDLTLVDVSGGGAVLTTKNISANGTYNASSDSADGYSQVNVAVPASAVDSGTKNITANGNGQDVVGYAAVNVAVPNSYSAGDEGKVVSSGALVAQTAHADVTPTTSDQTIDTTTNDSIKVKGDADLVASNIKKDVEIFGVTGSYEGGGGGSIGGLANLPDISDPEKQVSFMFSQIKNGNTVGGTFTAASKFSNVNETLLVSTGLPVVHGIIFSEVNSNVPASVEVGQTNKHVFLWGRNFTDYPNHKMDGLEVSIQGVFTGKAGYDVGTRLDAQPIQGIFRIDSTNGDIYYTARYNKNDGYQIIRSGQLIEWLAW